MCVAYMFSWFHYIVRKTKRSTKDDKRNRNILFYTVLVFQVIDYNDNVNKTVVEKI